MILTGNSYLLALIFGCIMLSFNIFRLENDFKRIEYQDSFCIFRSYMGYVSATLFNYSFVLQAVYRYILIMYPMHLFWQSAKFQTFFIAFTWILGFTYPLAFIFSGDIIYDVNNQVCQIPLQLSFPVVYIAILGAIFPILLIMFIYFKLVRYVHKMSKRIIQVNTLFRARRELKMVRRTVILISILITVTFPYVIFMFMSFFKRQPKSYFRIADAFSDLSLFLVIITLFQFTEPLKTSVMKRVNGRVNMVTTQE
ncbi:unnamed protein product [Adineta steineri]|uniref:G-protein coupled receptors family 1 profile domain-containing protein n=1 Tax=Adineta steineri TaxID=433720 RepID=A0A815R597_9BILA|nr:unnamed protein product [Adineta steineri]